MMIIIDVFFDFVVLLRSENDFFVDLEIRQMAMPRRARPLPVSRYLLGGPAPSHQSHHNAFKLKGAFKSRFLSTTLPLSAWRCRNCSAQPWSSLVEGDEQLDRHNSQTTKELFHARVAYFFGLNTNRTAYCLGQYSLYILLLKRSML